MARNNYKKSEKLKKITKAKLENPSLGVREIAKKTGVSKSTVATYLDKIGQLKIPGIDEIIGLDLSIIKLGQAIILDKLTNTDTLNKVGILDIAKLLTESCKRYEMLTGGKKGNESNEVKVTIDYKE